MTVLLIHVLKNRLASGLLDSPDLADLVVITELGHLQSYPDGVEVHLVHDVRDAAQVLPLAVEINARRPLTYVFSPFELGQPVAALVRTTLGLPGLGYDAVLAASHKYTMKRRMERAGIRVPASRLVASVEQVPAAVAALGGRAVVKPVLGGGSIDVTVLDGADEAAAFPTGQVAASLAGRRDPVLVEELVDIRSELHCDAVVHDGTVQAAVVSRYLAPLLDAPDGRNGSYVLPDDSRLAAEVRDVHAATVRALGLGGAVTHMEFFDTEDGLIAGEIAVRPSGGGVPAAVRRAVGLDLWTAFLDVSFGRDPRAVAAPQDGVVVNLHLPVRSGTITAVSDEESLLAAPHVEAVEMSLKAGDVVPGTYNSSYTTGVVFLRVPREEDVVAAVDEVMSRYVFATEADEREAS
jgi:biotin carboxylase